MKKQNIQATLSLLIAGAVFGVVSTASAATANLYVSPASATKKAGEVITATVGINTGANKIYAIEGTLVFDKLTCQSITVASGFQALSTPTCASPKFVLGIPGGSADSKTVLTVVTKAGTDGTATISLTGVNIVGGDTIKSISTSGGSASYTIGAVVKEPEPVAKEIVGTIATPTAPAVKTTEANKKATTETVAEATTEVTSTATTTATSTEPQQPEGTVLAGFDEQTPVDDEGNLLVNGAKILGGIVIVAIVVLIGWFVFKKKK